MSVLGLGPVVLNVGINVSKEFAGQIFKIE
jgi:hypothetical protein